MREEDLAKKCLDCKVPWDKCNPKECLDVGKKMPKVGNCLDTCGQDPKCWVAGGDLDMSKCPLNQSKKE